MADKIRISDAVEAGFCVSGVRKWFKAKGLNFRDFCGDGMTREQLGNDHYVDRIFAVKEEKASGQVSKS